MSASVENVANRSGEEKRALLLHLLKQRNKKPRTSPLSYGQERLWFLQQMDPDDATYNIVLARCLSGSLMVGAFEQSLNEVVRRHESLRTTFGMEDGQPVQIIAPPQKLALHLLDLGTLPPQQLETEAKRIMDQEAGRAFDLANDPPLRTALLNLGNEQHIFLITMHHIVSDTWSLKIFERELAVLYKAFCDGEASPLPDLSIQYADFARWQRQHLRGEALDAQLGYWEQQLGDSLPVLDLPTDHPRPPVQSHKGGAHSIVIEREVGEAIAALSRDESVTLYMTLLAAFNALLYRYTAQRDIITGIPVSGRSRIETESLIGFFVNTLVLRIKFSHDMSFRELLTQVRKQLIDAYSNQDLPFERLVERFQPDRSLSHMPLFQVTFDLKQELAEIPNLSQAARPTDLRVGYMEVSPGTSKADIGMMIIENEKRLFASIEYSLDLFEHATIEQMLRQFQMLLESVAANPEKSITDVNLLSESEAHQILVGWNQTGSDYARDQCIHHLFESQVRRTPNAIALVCEAQQFTYGDLNARANQLANYLRGMGVGPEVPVAVYMQRSPEMIVALLGILKAGGAYVPLDVSYPKERVSFILDEMRTPVVLTQQRHAKGLTGRAERLFCVDAQGDELATCSDENPNTPVMADNLAYIIYTSGSTGIPKGVAVIHRGVVRLVNNITYANFDGEVILQAASASFDASTFEIWASLLNGSKLVQMPAAVPSLDELTEIIERCGITTAFFTPALIQQIIDFKLESLKGIRQLLIGGDVFPISHARRFLETCKESVVINVYGPTENTCFTTYYQILSVDDLTSCAPIGRPISNTEMYVLSDNLQPVPIRVRGELYTGGDGLARGYVNRPDLTAERFVPNPFSTKPGERIYKTGDQARYRRDGNIEFLGRYDHQVKIRGYRIELEEIELTLGSCAGVREAIVVAREFEAGDKRLVAYVVANEGAEVSPADLRGFLKGRLPNYMVPTMYVMLDHLPVTPSGKVDREALPAPDESRAFIAREIVAPRTPQEEILAGVWSKILQVEQVSIFDNFFELGGDSILTMQVVARAKQAGLRLSPKDIFYCQTIAELASMPAEPSRAQAEQAVVTGTLPLTPIQRWFFEQEIANKNYFTQWVMIELGQSLKPWLVSEAVRQLLLHHDALRLRFVKEQQGWHQTNCDYDNEVAFQQVDLSEATDAEQMRLLDRAATELLSNVDIGGGTLLRAATYSLGAGKPDRLLIAAHHLCVDGVSWRILLEDFQTVYDQLSRDGSVELPAKTTSFKQWAQLTAEQAQSKETKRELDYWLDESRRAAPALPLDFAANPSESTIRSSDSVTVTLGVDETRLLLSEAPPRYGARINDVLLTALAQAFAKWTGERQLLIEMESHGREEFVEGVDLSRTVGWFTSSFPLLLNIEAAQSNAEAVALVRDQLQQIPRRGIGYGLLRYCIEDEEVRDRFKELPRPQVIFNYLGQFDQVSSEENLFKICGGGLRRSLDDKRGYVLLVESRAIRKQLQFTWAYGNDLHLRSTVERLASAYLESLRLLIHCGPAGRTESR